MAFIFNQNAEEKGGGGNIYSKSNKGGSKDGLLGGGSEKLKHCHPSLIKNCLIIVGLRSCCAEISL